MLPPCRRTRSSRRGPGFPARRRFDRVHAHRALQDSRWRRENRAWTARSACSIPAGTARSRSPSRSPSTARPARATARSSFPGVTAASTSTSSTRPITRRTVRLNWLDINGAGARRHGIRIASGNLAGTSIVVENTTSMDSGARHFGSAHQWRQAGDRQYDEKHTRCRESRIRATSNRDRRERSECPGAQIRNRGLGGEWRRQGDDHQFMFSGSTFGLDIEQANTEALAET